MYYINDDDITSFHQGNTIIMYYNHKKQTITLLAVLVPYNRRYLWNKDKYLFYDCQDDIDNSQISLMSFHNMIANVERILNYFNISLSKHVRYCLT
jgi:hypothetical protein